MIQREFKIDYVEKNHSELNDEEKELLCRAKSAALKAYAPYSHFRVGASVLLENGEYFSGSNQENAAFPSGLCAERVTMFYANAQFPDVAVKAIMIVVVDKEGHLAQRVTPPCGACRQSLLESEFRSRKNIKVLLASDKSVMEFASVADLLPLTFTGDDLL